MQTSRVGHSGLEAHAKSSIMCDYPETLNTLANVSSMSHNASSHKFEMVGGYTEDLTEPQNCQNWWQLHAQEWVLACIRLRGKEQFLVVKHNTF